MTNRSRLVIIDGDFIPYYICYNSKNDEGVVVEKTLAEVYEGINTYISNILNSTKADKFIGFLTPSKTFRNEINPDYKAQRKPSTLCYLFEAKLFLKQQYKFKTVESLEADDLCLITENIFNKDFDCLIVSPDKDLLNTRGIRYNPRTKELSNCSQDEEELYFWTSMITGDSVDNIKGIPGKGIKYVNKLFGDPLNFITSDKYPQIILNEYIKHFGEYNGVTEFYKNYKSLKILKNPISTYDVLAEDFIDVNVSASEC